MGTFHKVAKTTDIAEGKAICVEVGPLNIALFNLGGTFHAIADECSHEDGPLSEGDIDGTSVECPWHMACFDITTGKALSEPACGDVASYPVRVVGEDVEVEVD